jgi:choline dehydrogenase-like flavoprotein
VKAVEAEIDGDRWLFRSHLVVLAAGAINTAALLLRSADSRHPHGLSNGSDQVGRNLMKPQLTSILQLASRSGRGHDQRSLGINDFYWGDQNVDFPLGHIQSGGGVLQDALFAESPPVLSLVSKLMPDFGLEQLAGRSLTWWAMTGVAPDAHNRVSLRGDQVQIHYEANNLEAHDRLVYRWIDCLKAVEADPLTQVVKPAPTHPRGQAPLSVLGVACGTCRMGSNPATSVVNLQGQSHEVNNLFVADASVLPSCPSVGIGLTVIANAIRVADHLKEIL